MSINLEDEYANARAESPSTLTELASKQLSEDWPELADLIPQPRETEFPLDLLPKSIRDYVEEVAAVTELPVGAIAALSISLVSAAAGGSIRIPGFGGDNRPCVIWTMLLGETRSGKSQALGLLTKPLKDAARQSREEHQQRAEAKSVELARAKKRVQDAENRKFNPNTQNDDERELQTATDLLRRINEEIGEPRDLLASDITPEKIPDLLLACGHRGFTLYSTEAKEIMNIASGIYSGGVIRIDHLLKGHDGDDIDVRRKGAEDTIISDSVIGFLGAIQPGVLRNIKDWDEFTQRGFASRMHFIDPGPERVRTFARTEIDPQKQERFVQVIRKITDFNPDQPHVFQNGPGVADAVRDIRVRMERLVQPGKEYQPIMGSARTAGEFAHRIAALLTTARAAEEQAQEIDSLSLPTTISAQSILEGARITEEYLLPTNLTFAEGLQRTQIELDIETLKALALEHGSEPINTRTLRACLPRTYRAKEKLNTLRKRWLEQEFVRLVERSLGSNAIEIIIHPEIVRSVSGTSND